MKKLSMLLCLSLIIMISCKKSDPAPQDLTNLPTGRYTLVAAYEANDPKKTCEKIKFAQDGHEGSKDVEASPPNPNYQSWNVDHEKLCMSYGDRTDCNVKITKDLLYKVCPN